MSLFGCGARVLFQGVVQGAVANFWAGVRRQCRTKREWCSDYLGSMPVYFCFEGGYTKVNNNRVVKRFSFSHPHLVMSQRGWHHFGSRDGRAPLCRRDPALARAGGALGFATIFCCADVVFHGHGPSRGSASSIKKALMRSGRCTKESTNAKQCNIHGLVEEWPSRWKENRWH